MQERVEQQQVAPWRQALTAFEKARDALVIEASTGRLVFAQMAGERLFSELRKPGVIDLGRIVMTRGAEDALSSSHQIPAEFIVRHKFGDWGDLDEADKAENELSVQEGFRVVSAYHTKRQEKLYVITEHDRSLTTLLRPKEY